ncbi:MAG: ATP-binding protein, partial [Planctomycetota bacterium]
LVVSGYMNSRMEDRFALSSAREASHSLSQTVLCHFRRIMMTGDAQTLREMLPTLVKENPAFRDIRIVSHATGAVIASHGGMQDARYGKEHNSCRICHDPDDPVARSTIEPYDEIEAIPDSGRILSVITPVFNDAGCRNAACHAHSEAMDLLGLVEADFSLAYVDDMSVKRNLRTLGMIGIAVALSFAAAWFFVSRFLNRPVRDLIQGMNRLAERKFEFRLDENRNDEFGTLAVSFNDMASMLSSSLTELKKSREYLQGILESSADIIITVNASGKIQTVNMGTENALGYHREEIVGQPIDILFADSHDRKIAGEKLKHSDNVVNYETRFLTQKGEARDMLLTLSRLRNPQGAVIGTIGIGKDITQEKQLQKQLIQSQRLAAIGQVFTGIQHSMKNMLNACKGGAFMVKTGLAKDNRKMLVEGWDMVQQGISRMTDMSMDMLKYVKEWKPKLASVDLTPTLSEIDAVIKQTAKDKGIDFKLHIPETLPLIVCDARMMHTAVMDIVSNAIDACFWKEYGEGEVPEVVVRPYIDHDEGRFVIEIRDNGCGMTDEIKANIFTPFFSTKSKAGTGLGLSITSRIIGVHDGKIDVDSEPDHGTIFRIVIPVHGPGNFKESFDGEKGTGSR